MHDMEYYLARGFEKEVAEYYVSGRKRIVSVVPNSDFTLTLYFDICENNNLPVINLVHNLGIGGAVQTGYKYAYKNGYDAAIQFDGDGQHDANYIKDLIEPIKKGTAEMTIGSRYVEDLSEFKSTKMRQAGIKFLSSILKLTTKKRIYDMKPYISDDTVFEPLKNYSIFSRAYLDDSACVSWDIDPEVDSNIVWSNKLDLCPDSCYIYSKPA